MEYVRRLRLKAASRELLSAKADILEIAVRYRFESQDGFCRAFKRYYGIPPGEYRKLNRKLANKEKSQEAGNIMYDMAVYESLVCSNTEKKEALAILDKLLELSGTARKCGLLALERDMDAVWPEYFKKALQLLIDGVEPETLGEILRNLAFCGNYRGKELLIRILILEGILCIQQGTHTRIIQEKLSSFFGDDFIGVIQKHLGMDADSLLDKLEAYIGRMQDKPPLARETSLLEEPLIRMDSRSLQRLLREVDSVTLAAAICGTSDKVCKKVLRHVSSKRACELIDELEISDCRDIREIAVSQEKLLETMHVLKSQGDLLI